MGAGALRAARTLGALGRGDEALAALRRAVDVKPDLADALRTLGDHLTAIGDFAGADDAYMRQIKASTRDSRFLGAAAAMTVNRLAPAEARLREHLKQHPTEVSPDTLDYVCQSILNMRFRRCIQVIARRLGSGV